MSKIYHNIFPGCIISVSATTKIKETRQTSKLTCKIPLAETRKISHLFEDPQCGMIFQKIFKESLIFDSFVYTYVTEHSHVFQ